MLGRFRAVIYFAVLFVVLFASHIIFAATNNDFLFRIVVVFITILTFFAGPICALIESEQTSYGASFTHGMLLSLPLSTGLGWAYNGMTAGFEMVIFPILSGFIHLAIRQSVVGTTYGLK
tara:strand:- start:20 stop:379 length:360 start_codon:yes stop_codon:yes gene_type:complete